MDNKNYPELETTLTRTTHGELVALRASDEDRARLASARELVALAAKSGKIPAARDTIERERRGFSGSALHHEIYDLNPSASVVLLCLRRTQGTKYGVGTLEKRYVLLRRHGRGVSVEDVPSGSAVARWAKQGAGTVGFAIAQCCRLAAKIAA